MKSQTCKICSIIFRDKDVVIKGVEIKACEYNKRSLIRPDRCFRCENIEQKISDKCVCGGIIFNYLERYIQKGNSCDRCINRVNLVLSLKRNIEYAKFELNCRILDEELEEIKQDEENLKINSDKIKKLEKDRVIRNNTRFNHERMELIGLKSIQIDELISSLEKQVETIYEDIIVK